jgi:lysyl oxidase
VRRRRAGLAAAASCSVLLLLPGSPGWAVRADDRAPTPLPPNIQTLQPTGLRVVTTGQTRLLRFSNTIANVGPGPVELQPRKHDCDGDGDPANDRGAIQRVYRDVDGDGIFRRPVDSAVTARVAGCFAYDEAHGHWHFRDFADYRLLDVDSGETIAANHKVGFCLLDTLHPYPGVPGSPGRRYYRDCRRNSMQGQSVGYADIYEWFVRDQSIDVTGTPAGEYCLVTTADPADQLLESDESDNAYRQRIRLASTSVVPLARAC